jgi:hypothetical protein
MLSSSNAAVSAVMMLTGMAKTITAMINPTNNGIRPPRPRQIQSRVVGSQNKSTAAMTTVTTCAGISIPIIS